LQGIIVVGARETKTLTMASEITLPGAATSAPVVVPQIIVEAGGAAVHCFQQFFAAGISNRNTRAAYLHAVTRFFSWCDQQKQIRLAVIQPRHISAYISVLSKHVQKPTVKQHLAAIRTLLDLLVTHQVIQENPARAVSGPKHVARGGRTTVLDVGQAHKFLDNIDSSSVVGLRDLALIGVMTFAFARVGAVVAMCVEDYYRDGQKWWIRLHEKSGKQHRIEVHPALKACLDAYLDASGIRSDSGGPLFRSAIGRTGKLTDKSMNRIDAWRMIQRRAADLDVGVRVGCHTFRASGITAYLESGGTVEDARAMAAHISGRTTKLYDRGDLAAAD
jgi:site-specific recombinase XerD